MRRDAGRACEDHRATLVARRARERKPRDTGGDRGADRGIEPQCPPAGLPRIPDTDDLLRIDDRLALGLGALGLGGCTGGDALSFLCSAMGAHGSRLA